jgi:hypothetical protein
MKAAVLWVVPPCSQVEVYRRSKGACCLHHQEDETSLNLHQTTGFKNYNNSHIQEKNQFS